MRRVVLMVDDKMNKNELREEAKGRNKGRRRLTADAKRAMAEGRERSRTIDLYLKSLETHKYQRRTVVVDRKELEAKIKEIDARKAQGFWRRNSRITQRPGPESQAGS